MDFYTSEKVTDHITRIRPYWNDACMYFVQGEERGLLIDTGYGFGDLRSYVETLTDRPYDVVLSHGHLDHANGAGQWNSVWMSHLDIDLYHTRCEISERKKVLKKFIPEIDSFGEEKFIPVFTGEFRDLRGGEVFDLGGVSVEAIAAPGHTKGMMVFLVREDRVILFGDACGVHTLFISPESTSLEEFCATLDVLKSHEEEYDRILRQHGTCESPKELLDEDIAIVKSILDGTDDHEPTQFEDIPCFIARRLDPLTHRRADGKEGNILYVPEKIRRMN